MNIALAGKSGSGKTTVAEYLVRRHGYFRCSTGDVCREVCRILFGTEARGTLNRVTDAMKTVDDQVWLKAALRRIPVGVPVVFDSMRFVSDYVFLVARGYRTWKIQAPNEIRWNRMQDRHQEFSASDDEHRAEWEIEEKEFDVTLDNGSNDFDSLFFAIEEALRRCRLPLGTIWLFTTFFWTS